MQYGVKRMKIKKLWKGFLPAGTGLLFTFLFSCCAFAQTDVVEVNNDIEFVEMMDYVEMIYDAGNGMETSEANALLQDEQGYIWVGSYGGLLRYCGHEFLNMSAQRQGAPQSGVRALFEDSANRIWIGTNDAGVYVYDQDVFKKAESASEELRAEVDALSVRTIAEDRDGTIYIGTTKGIFVQEEDLQLKKVSNESVQGRTIEKLFCDSRGYMWGMMKGDRWFFMKDGELWEFSAMEMLGLELGKGFLETKDGDIYLGTDENTVIRLKLKDMQKPENGFTMELLSTGDRETINDIYEDNRGQIWICSDRGIGYFDEDDTFYEVHGLSIDTIMDQMLEDYEGNLWIASSRRGIFELSRSKFKNVGYEAGVENQTVNASVLYHNSLYIGTDDGLSIMDENGVRIENALTEELQGIRIRSFMQDSQGNLWIATYREKGLICYDDRTGKWFAVATEQGMPTEKVRVAKELSDGRIAAATNSGVAILQDGKVTKVYNKENGIENEVILCLMQKEDGTLLAGSDGNGIYEIDLATDKVQNITTRDGLESGVILCMAAEEESGGILISNGNGLSLMTENGISSLDPVKEIAGSIFDIEFSGEDVWLLKSSGIVKIERERLLNGISVYEALTRKDGLTSNITANSSNYISKDGMLFLCTGNGIYFIDTQKVYKNTSVPRIAVGLITTDDQSYYGAQDIVLSADNMKVTLSLELLSFGAGEGRLEYYLEGFDKSPTKIRNRMDSSVNYTNLPGGTYTFRMKGYNSDGIESEELSFKITKEHSIFERWYLRALLGAGLLLLVFLCVIIAQYLRKKQMMKRQMEYKNLTDQSIRMVAKAIDAKDEYTNGHSHRVAAYAVEIGRRYGLSEEQLEQLYYSALLHDIGKIGIPDHILNKKGSLTDEEYELIKQHPAIGGKILEDFTLVPWIAAGAEYHHERYDGKGYNKGLKGQEIPLYARIISVADAFDGMNSTRIYRKSMTEDFIYHEMEKGKGTQFDEKFVSIMLQMMDEKFEVL